MFFFQESPFLYGSKGDNFCQFSSLFLLYKFAIHFTDKTQLKTINLESGGRKHGYFYQFGAWRSKTWMFLSIGSLGVENIDISISLEPGGRKH